MTKLLLLYAVSLATGHALGATLPHRRNEVPEEFKWPKFCSDVNLRDTTLLNSPEVFAKIDPVRKYVGLNYKNKNPQGEDVTVPEWMARWHKPNYEWKCNSASCNLGNFETACKAGEVAGDFGVTLEQFSGLYSYLRSLSDAIENQRGYLMGKLPIMFSDFGAELKDGVPWDKTIGLLSAGVSTIATVISGPAGGIVSSGFGLAGAVAGFLVPEEGKEKKFDWYADASSGLVDNVNLIMKAIDSWVDLNFMKPISDIGLYINLEGNLFFTVGEGRFAANPPPPLVSKTDENILASLAAPFLNQLLQDSRHAVVIYDGPEWKKITGKDLCGDPNLKFYEELQPDGHYCDANGNLAIIMRYSSDDLKGNRMANEKARNVKAISKWGDYGITPHQIIEGSVANYDAGGYGHMPSPEEAIERLKGMQGAQGIEQIAWGKMNVWNLPVCFTGPGMRWSTNRADWDSIEEWMASAMQSNCGQHKDKNGNSFPYGDAYCGEPRVWC